LKDGVKTDFFNHTSNIFIESIAVSGGSVYVAGTYADNGNYIACYWKDGVQTKLYSGSASANAIAVVTQ
jgi:hypothetical protein